MRLIQINGACWTFQRWASSRLTHSGCVFWTFATRLVPVGAHSSGSRDRYRRAHSQYSHTDMLIFLLIASLIGLIPCQSALCCSVERWVDFLFYLYVPSLIIPMPSFCLAFAYLRSHLHSLSNTGHRNRTNRHSKGWTGTGNGCGADQF